MILMLDVGALGEVSVRSSQICKNWNLRRHFQVCFAAKTLLEASSVGNRAGDGGASWDEADSSESRKASCRSFSSSWGVVFVRLGTSCYESSNAFLISSSSSVPEESEELEKHSSSSGMGAATTGTAEVRVCGACDACGVPCDVRLILGFFTPRTDAADMRLSAAMADASRFPSIDSRPPNLWPGPLGPFGPLGPEGPAGPGIAAQAEDILEGSGTSRLIAVAGVADIPISFCVTFLTTSVRCLPSPLE